MNNESLNGAGANKRYNTGKESDRPAPMQFWDYLFHKGYDDDTDDIQ